MTYPHFHTAPTIPGAVAAWYRGDGDGAAQLLADTFAQRDPMDTAMQLIQYVTFGWLGVLDQHGVILDVSAVEDYWNALAQEIAAGNA